MCIKKPNVYFHRRCFLVTCLVFIASIVHAQTLGLPNDTAIYSNNNRLADFLVSDTVILEEVVVHGPLFTRELKNIPSNIARLNSTKIETDGAVAIVEKLNQVPGIYAHTGAINTNRITIRGVGSRTPYSTNRIKAYWNGIPISEGDGSTNIDDFDPVQINSIEVIRGTKSALYGMGLGGVLLISSKQARYNGLHGSVGAEFGDFRTYKPYVALGYKTPKTSLSIHYSHNNTNGWRQNSAYKRNNLGTSFSFTGNKLTTDLYLNLVNIDAQIPSSLNENTFNNSPDSAAANWLAVNGREVYSKLISGIRVKARLSESISNTTTIFYSAKSGEEIRPFNILDDLGTQFGIRSFFEWKTKHLQLKTGIELLHNTYSWKTFEVNNAQKGEEMNSFSEKRLPYSIFFQGSYDFFQKNILEFGLSYNTISYSLEDDNNDTVSMTDSYSYEPIISPFIGVNIPIGSNLIFYSSVAHGFSPPTVEETLLPDGVPNTSLKPESGWNFEAGARITALNNRLYIDGTLYWMSIKNLLVTKRISEEIFYGENAGQTTHIGFELQANYRLNFAPQTVIRKTDFSISYTANNHTFTDFTDDGNNYDGNYLPGIPNHNLVLGLRATWIKHVFIDYNFSYHGKQFLNDSNSESYAGYSIHNIRIGIDVFRLRPKQTRVYLGVKNLFNEHYASMILVNAPSFGGALPRYYYPGLPRYIYGGIKITF